MPVSVVCETTASVNAALRESLGSTGGVSCSQAANAKANAAVATADDNKPNGSSSSAADDVDTLHGKLVASAKRVLLSKIDYEEVSNYGQTVLDSLKSKYIVLKPTVNNSMENGRNSPATCNNNNNGANSDSAADANGNSTAGVNTNCGGGGGAGLKKPSNPNELPAPKRVLYPRENVRIGWKSTGRKWDVGVGMMNVGNTCYLNSTLQALFHVPSMANWLMSDTAHMERCESTDSGCIICAMAKTLQASQNSQSAIRPYFVYSKLKSICKHLVMGRQEDAHEFLRYLVEAMEKSYLSRFRNFKELDQYSKETTPMNQILGGYLKSSVKCLSCNHVSVTFQHFQDLLLDIRKADTVDEALEGYFSRERLEDMGYKCEACKKKVSATKQFSLERAPIALCIQLKRFSMSGTKINKQITIKPRLDLTKFAVRKIPGEQLTYRLVAMVTHLGASQHCGHYTAIGLTESGSYYNYDDSYVRPISIQNVCNTNAYIIFYEMDTQPPRQVTSTQVSGAQVATAVSSTSPKLNGHVIGSSPQRIIGPQLPPSFSNNATSGSKLILNRNNTPTTSSTSLTSSSSASSNSAQSSSKISSKIMIHFKNNNATSTANSSNVKMSAATSSITSASATSSTTTNGSSNSAFDYLKNSNDNDEVANKNHTSSNGLHTVGTGKFQDTGMGAKCSLGKRQNNITKNNNESSSSDDDDDENEIVSSSTTTTATNNNANSQAKTLPSMPKLGLDSINNNTFSGNTMKSPLSNGFAAKKSSAPIKSLVPYGSETEEEETEANTTNSTTATSTVNNQDKRIVSNPLKRRQSSSSWSSASSSENEADTDQDQKPTTGIKIKKAASSTISGNSSKTNAIKNVSDSTNKHCNGISKKSSDTIDNIFNSIKRSTNNGPPSTTATTSTITNGCVSSSPQKKKSQNTNQQFTVTSTTPATPADSFSSSSSSDSEDNAKVRPQFKRSHSTPPSPPVVKTNSGIWQVTSLHPISACVSPTAEKVLPKNPKNPFASKPLPLSTNGGENNKRLKKENRTFVGNGYQSGVNGGGGAANDSTVSELLKHSHRGYGAPVLTWNGQQSEIFRENYNLFDEKRIEDDSDDNNTTTTTTTTNNNNGIDIIEFENIDDFMVDIEKSPRLHTTAYKSRDEFLLQDELQEDDEIQQRLYNNDIDLEMIEPAEPSTADPFKDDDDDFNIDDEDDDYAILQRESPSSSSAALLFENNKHPINYPLCRQDLHLDLNILNSDTSNYNNNNCLPPIGTTILTLSSSTNISTKPKRDEQSQLQNLCCTSNDNESDNGHLMLNIDNSSPKTNTTTNTYCLSPNSTDNEPTTPTLATTINDIIFQFSDDSLDNL